MNNYLINLASLFASEKDGSINGVDCSVDSSNLALSGLELLNRPRLMETLQTKAPQTQAIIDL